MKSLLDIKSIKRHLLDILFPTKCPGCQTKNEIFCPNCINKIHLSREESGDNIMSLFDYHDPIIKNAIWAIKYHHKRYLGEKLGQLLYESFIEDISELKALTGRSILVIPVPVSKKKLKLRWYNQAEVIAKGFCRSGGQENLKLKNNIVYKKFETIPQVKILSREKRLKNIKGVFDIKNENIIKGRTIIVIDDVTTTGGTMTEIMKILKKSGARKVIGLAVAH